MDAAEFEHQALDLGRNQIRLVTIHPRANDQAPLRCSVTNFNDEDCPKYQALSYVWGMPAPLYFIELNGYEFGVRQGLWHFLERISRSGIKTFEDGSLAEPRFFWIDQLCIDQSSTKERNHQVGRMREIFQNATRVIAWLGHDRVANEKGLELIATIDPVTFPRYGRATDRRMCQQWFFKHTTALQELVRLLQCQYWQRVWIVQEFLLPKKLILMWGNAVMRSEMLHTVISICLENTLVYRARLPRWVNEERRSYRETLTLSLTWKLLDLRQESHLFPSESRCVEIPLEKVVRDFSGLSCADARDKVYALASLIDPKATFEIDYTRSAQQLFWELVAKLNGKHMEMPYLLKDPLERLANAMNVTGHLEKHTIDVYAWENLQTIYTATASLSVFIMSLASEKLKTELEWATMNDTAYHEIVVDPLSRARSPSLRLVSRSPRLSTAASTLHTRRPLRSMDANIRPKKGSFVVSNHEMTKLKFEVMRLAQENQRYLTSIEAMKTASGIRG